MKNCPRCGVKFNSMLESIDHDRTFKHHYKQMDPIKKATIIARVEGNLYKFLLGYGMPSVVKAPLVVTDNFSSSVPEKMAPGWLPEPNWVG